SSSRCTSLRASESSASQRARSAAGPSVGTPPTSSPPAGKLHFTRSKSPFQRAHPFWSRNRLTFLQNARYQHRARSRFTLGSDPNGCDFERGGGPQIF